MGAKTNEFLNYLGSINDNFLKPNKTIMTEALELTFQNIKIGIKDCNGLELFNGDTIKINVAKDVTHKGIIVYNYGAFCLKRLRCGEDTYDVTPLCNYAIYCKITKIK